MTADLSGEFDDLGDAAMGRPEHPAVQFGPGLVGRSFGHRPEGFPEPS